MGASLCAAQAANRVAQCMHVEFQVCAGEPPWRISAAPSSTSGAESESGDPAVRMIDKTFKSLQDIPKTVRRDRLESGNLVRRTYSGPLSRSTDQRDPGPTMQ